MEYKDADGNPITLHKLVRTEPDWAANVIRQGAEQLAAARAELDGLREKMGRVAVGFARWVDHVFLTSSSKPELVRLLKASNFEALFAAYLESEDYKKEMGDGKQE